MDARDYSIIDILFESYPGEMQWVEQHCGGTVIDNDENWSEYFKLDPWSKRPLKWYLEQDMWHTRLQELFCQRPSCPMSVAEEIIQWAWESYLSR